MYYKDCFIVSFLSYIIAYFIGPWKNTWSDNESLIYCGEGLYLSKKICKRHEANILCAFRRLLMIVGRILKNIKFDQAYFTMFPCQGSSSQVRRNA